MHDADSNSWKIDCTKECLPGQAGRTVWYAAATTLTPKFHLAGRSLLRGVGMWKADDLPVPAAPLKKTFSPRIARSAAERCSAVRQSADTAAAAAAEDEDDDEEEDDGAARSFWAAISRSISADVAALSENAAAAAGVYEAENVPELAAADEDAEDEDEDEDEAEDEDSAEAADPDDDADE